ncbi:MAG: hypothetical protein J5554_08300 [Paludibacteraceae bacterium]|nr:hypothetical protein [Paludibacteraceae bacterium]
MKKIAFSLSTLLALMTESCVLGQITPSSNGQIGGHDYVDLGLPSGLKWQPAT